MSTAVETAARRRVVYPESDGKPRGETETQRQERSAVLESLKDFFRAGRVGAPARGK